MTTEPLMTRLTSQFCSSWAKANSDTTLMEQNPAQILVWVGTYRALASAPVGEEGGTVTFGSRHEGFNTNTRCSARRKQNRLLSHIVKHEYKLWLRRMISSSPPDRFNCCVGRVLFGRFLACESLVVRQRAQSWIWLFSIRCLQWAGGGLRGLAKRCAVYTL